MDEGQTLSARSAPASLSRPDALSDAELATQVAARDAASLGVLYDRYARAIYAMASRALGGVEAEEIVQDSFLRLWRSAAQYDPDRSAFVAWFMSVARHSIVDALQRRGLDARLRAAAAAEQALASVTSAGVDVETEAWQREEAITLRHALIALPEEQRRVLVLAYFGGLTHSAMAAQLGWPLGTVKKRVRLGLQKLRAALGGVPAAEPDAKRRGQTPGNINAVLRRPQARPVLVGERP